VEGLRCRCPAAGRIPADRIRYRIITGLRKVQLIAPPMLDFITDPLAAPAGIGVIWRAQT
jgi:hypothetical protein